jgi:hypothetical protein
MIRNQRNNVLKLDKNNRSSSSSNSNVYSNTNSNMSDSNKSNFTTNTLNPIKIVKAKPLVIETFLINTNRVKTFRNLNSSNVPLRDKSNLSKKSDRNHNDNTKVSITLLITDENNPGDERQNSSNAGSSSTLKNLTSKKSSSIKHIDVSNLNTKITINKNNRVPLVKKENLQRINHFNKICSNVNKKISELTNSDNKSYQEKTSQNIIDKKLDIKPTIPIPSVTNFNRGPSNYKKVLNHSSIDLETNGSMIKKFFDTKKQESSSYTKKIYLVDENDNTNLIENGIEKIINNSINVETVSKLEQISESKTENNKFESKSNKFNTVTNLNKDNKVDLLNIKSNLDLQIFNIYGLIKPIPNSSTKPNYPPEMNRNFGLKPIPPSLPSISTLESSEISESSGQSVNESSSSYQDESSLDIYSSSNYSSRTLENFDQSNRTNPTKNFDEKMSENFYTNLKNYSIVQNDSYSNKKKRNKKLSKKMLDYDDSLSKKLFFDGLNQSLFDFKHYLNDDFNKKNDDKSFNNQNDHLMRKSMYETIFQLHDDNNNRENAARNNTPSYNTNSDISISSIENNYYKNVKKKNSDSDIDDEDILPYNATNNYYNLDDYISSNSNTISTSDGSTSDEYREYFIDPYSSKSIQHITRQNRVVLFESRLNPNNVFRYEANLPVLPDTVNLSVDNDIDIVNNIKKKIDYNNNGNNSNGLNNKSLNPLSVITEEDV